jgi:putative nucleotidyltransferase with HDIG domain
VNVSPQELLHPGYPGLVALVLEITETALIPDERGRDATLTVRILRELGVRVFLDDFGSGYSSLERLAALPVDGLTLWGWAKAVELRDQETAGHTERVTALTLRLARALGVPEEDLEHIRRGAILHDVGKLAIPDHVLLKPGPLTEEEWAVTKKHPVYAYEWLSGIPFLRKALDIPYAHHERWDGSGYPRGLKGEAIPLSARIFAVVDVYDALTSDRPYRKAWPKEKALAYLREQAGRQFDPQVVATFLRLVEEEGL